MGTGVLMECLIKFLPGECPKICNCGMAHSLGSSQVGTVRVQWHQTSPLSLTVKERDLAWQPQVQPQLAMVAMPTRVLIRGLCCSDRACSDCVQQLQAVRYAESLLSADSMPDSRVASYMG